MAKYHKFVFDNENRKFVGNFDEMYQSELNTNFDSWHQEDTRHLPRNILLFMLNNYNFQNILDLGCGKGSLTHVLKKKNNSVTALDISSTAINMARERYPDIQFDCVDIGDIITTKEYFTERERPDLIVARELFSYLTNWREVLKLISGHTKYFIISLDIPDNPIGFVKSYEELYSEIERYFEIIECIKLYKHKHIIIFSKTNQ